MTHLGAHALVGQNERMPIDGDALTVGGTALPPIHG